MALVIKDRIKETTTTTGTGTYSLAGAEAGFQGFSEIGDGNTCYYACTDGTNFEVGIGTFTASGSTLARTTILESSNSDAAVNWGAGAKDIFVTAPADKIVYEDASGNISASGTVDGRDLATDGGKLDLIEASADVTDTANVTSAGALMDSEVTNLAQVKAFDSSDYATAAQGTTANAAMPTSGGTFTGDISFEGATANNYETTLTVADPTADRTITLPDQTGTAMLWQSDWPDDTGTTPNYAIGDEALNSLVSGGQHNVAYGYQALTSNTTGSTNVAIGNYALAYATTVSDNTAVGHSAGFGDTTAYGTFVGAYAGNYNASSKDYQTAIGYNAMNDQSGDYTTAVGANAMTDGDHYASTAVGYDALGRYFCSFPQYNTAVGSYSGNNIYSGDYNVLLGYATNTLYDSGTGGVAVGYQAKVSGNYTTSVGYLAGYSSFGVSEHCTLIGANAGRDLDGGDYNTFVGSNAGYHGGSGNDNTSVGVDSLRSLTSGQNNSSLGRNSLFNVTSGNDNTALGKDAGYSLSTGGSNTFLGYAAGQNQDGSTTNALTTGSNVTCVGFQAIPSSGTATNEITLGDNDITSLRCNVQTISSLSDERDKTAIADLTYGLDFINDMRPVEFTWNRRDGSLGAKPDMGFIAQELYDTELDHSSSSRTRLVNWENPEKLEADYVRSYPILVKAVQQLSAQVTALQARIETLEGN